MNFTNRHNIYRNPDLDGTGGGAAPADSPGGGAAPAADVGSAPAFDPAAFKNEILGTFRNEFGGFRQQLEGRFRSYDERLNPPKQEEGDKRPSMKDYDFNKDGEFERYQDDLLKFKLKEHRSEWEKEQTASRSREEQEARTQSILDSHAERQESYARANPDYNPDFPVAFKNAAVTLAVADSEYSAHIHHFFQKNPDKLSELRGIERDKGAIAALRYVGRLESQFEAQETAAPAKRAAASAMPTAGGFGGVKPAGAKQPSKEEIYDKWNS